MTKITIDRAIVEQALVALEDLKEQYSKHPDAFWDWSRGRASIADLKKTLEQPEQEPVALVDIHAFYENCANFSLFQKLPKGKHYLYTTPPAAQPEHGDIRALKYRIHELEGEVIGYKRIIEEAALKKLADLGQKIEQDPVAWTPVAEALPKSGVKVLACYRNRLGNLRRIRAMWTAAKTEEADGDAEACIEYDEAADTYYVTEGWYECIDNWDDYSSVAVTEGEVTHWMPLPQPPIEAAHGIKEPKP